MGRTRSQTHGVVAEDAMAENTIDKRWQRLYRAAKHELRSSAIASETRRRQTAAQKGEARRSEAVIRKHTYHGASNGSEARRLVFIVHSAATLSPLLELLRSPYC